MSDLEIIKALEKQLAEKLKPCLLTEIMNANARGCYVLDQKQQLIGLNLQHYKLTDISLIKTLTKLSKLNLALNKITDLQALKNLEQLCELNLQKNQIIDMSPLKTLQNLKNLSLQANKISDISTLSSLKNLNVLNLGSILMTDYKPLIHLIKLTHLNLSDNQISSSSLHLLKTMENLIELDLRFNQISSLEELKVHKKLTKLFLSSNQISKIEPLSQLTALTQLYLNANKIKTIRIIKDLNLLKLLDLKSNQINDINPLANLTTLTHLQLESNQISDISALKNLTHLTQLNLRYNQIEHIDALKKLNKLTHLYLSNNQLKALPRWLLNLNLTIKWDTGGEGISVLANPIATPPPAIIRKGNTQIKNFFDRLKKQTLNKVKVLLVGDKGVGKTSLSNALRHLPFNHSPAQTLGINIESLEHNELYINLWDFGGESNLLPAHKLFFSEHSLYILVLDNREQRNEERWLKRIQYYGKNSTILIVLNKFDEDNSYDLDRDDLLQRYKGLQGIFPVSSAQGVGLEVFKRGLIAAYQRVPSFNKALSFSAFQIKEILQKQQQLPCISYQSYSYICHSQGLKQPDMQQSLLELLHNLGYSLYFNELGTRFAYICKPQWLTEGLYKITTAALIANNKGVLFLKDLFSILNTENKESYSQKEQDYLIELMKKFHLCYQIDADRVFIPQLFNKANAEIGFDDSDMLQFKIQYKFLDELLMLRFLVALYSQVDIDKSSRNCLFLTHNQFNCSALIEADYDNERINIKINGENQRDYYAFIREILDNIHR